ncbi:hypothetical protein Tco_0331411 [Tanacetum coccineum]
MHGTLEIRWEQNIGKNEDSKALVTIDGEGVDWTSHSEEDEDYALMACNSSESDTEVTSCSNKCKESYTNLKKLYDAQREQLSDAIIEKRHISRFVIARGMHAVPPPMTGNYMPSGPDIEEYESNSEDEYVSIPTKEQATPSFANQQVKTPRETKDCDVHEEEDAEKKFELNNKLSRNSGQREIRPIWNNVQRVNKQNKFVPSAVLTRTGKIPVSTARASGTKNVSTARQSFNRQTVLTSTAVKINTVKPIVNRVRPANVFHKTHSPYSRPFNKTTILSTNFSKQKFNTAKVNVVGAVGGKGKLLLSPQQVVIGDHKDTTGTMHMTGNKAYLAEFQDFNGGPVAFGGSKGYITGKGKIKTGKLDFEDVCFVKELQHFNLFSVLQICNKKNKVLFTDSECFVLSPEFKLPDEN